MVRAVRVGARRVRGHRPPCSATGRPRRFSSARQGSLCSPAMMKLLKVALNGAVSVLLVDRSRCVKLFLPCARYTVTLDVFARAGAKSRVLGVLIVHRPADAKLTQVCLMVASNMQSGVDFGPGTSLAALAWLETPLWGLSQQPQTMTCV